MKLYLIQHAEAVSEDIAPERPLTPAGLNTARAMSERIAGLTLDVPAIWHSGKLRARQTAEQFAPQLAPNGVVRQHANLNPKDPVTAIVKEIDHRTEDLAIVGHLPYLSRLASYLLAGNEELPIIAFQKAGIAALERDTKGRWQVCWIIAPHLLMKPSR